MAKSKEYLLEMMPKDVSKQKALIRFAQSLEIRREEVMACGDNTNDIEMLEWAGLGVAVANAGAGAEKRGGLCGGSAAVFRRGGSGKEICSGVKVPKNKREKQRREDR